MPVIVSQTPNPNALKFTVGALFDAPKSFAAGKPTDDPVAAPLLAIAGVTSVFMSADFVTLTKDPEAFWDEIVPEAIGVLEITFG
ncbi:MAG TPA: NifU N-terminal domain-containing protein [Acidimicrobiia bacterium]|nr:NifU N-terminal domain-containing protein [Acidimicrobiia bacterium]